MFDFIIALLILSLMSILFGFAGLISGAAEISQLCYASHLHCSCWWVSSTSVTAYRKLTCRS